MKNRILTEHNTEAMVAADSFALIVERIRPMVTSGRTMVLAVRECTYLGRPPKVYGGLRLCEDANGDGFRAEAGDKDVWCGIVLTSGEDRYEDRIGFGFGESIYRYSGNETEQLAWDRYHAHQAECRDPFQRRRDMTHIEIIGGIAGRRYTREDSITISAWNRDGVCTEKVLGFEPGDGSW